MKVRFAWRIALVWVLMILGGAAFPARAAISAPAAVQLAAAQHIVTQIVFDPPSPNILRFGDNVTINFNYSTTYPAGVRIFPRPLTQGLLTPNYAASGSPVFPVGSGSGSAFFTITSAEVVVDQVRFEMVAADTNAVLADYFVPVYYQFSGAANMPYDIILAPPTPNILQNGQNVTLNYHFTASNPGGILIFPRPMTNGSLTPNYAASGSGLYTGNGTTSDFFHISSGTPTVDQIRFLVTNADQSVTLGTFFLPVNYQVTAATTNVNFIVLTPPTGNPNVLQNNQSVNLTFLYTTTNLGGVRIFARPITRGALTPNYAASGSLVYATGSGSGSGDFTITTGNVVVDGIRFQVLNADQSTLLFEAVIPVHYQFGATIYQLFLPFIAR